MRHLDPGTLDPTLRKAIHRIADAPSVRAIVLFGSRARGDHRADSDWDLCAIVRDDASDVGRATFRAMTRDVDAVVEWHVIREADYGRRSHVPGWLAHEVAEDGALVAGTLPHAAPA